MQSIDILLIDANKLFREGLKRLLDNSPFVIAAESDTLTEGLEKLSSGLQSKIALVEFDAGNDDVQQLQQLREKWPDIKLVVLAATTRNVHHLARCFEAGADGRRGCSGDARSVIAKSLIHDKTIDVGSFEGVKLLVGEEFQQIIQALPVIIINNKLVNVEII